MKKRYNYRIYPNKIQREYIEAIFNINRFIWNQFLAANIRYYNHSKKFHFFNEMSSILTECKNIEGYEWLKSVPSTSLQQTLRHLDRAIKDSYKKKKGFPKFKKKYDKNSFTLTNLQYSIKENKLKIALLKSLMKVKWHRELPSEPTSCTIIKDNIGRYYVSFVVEVGDKIVPYTNSKVGLDLGIETFCSTSDGKKYKLPNLKPLYKKVKRQQKELSRKKKGSNNFKKQKLKLAKTHMKIVDKRNDFHNKLVSTLINENQVISIETLKITNMIQKSNKSLSRLISQQGWSLFITKLINKATECNRIIYKVDTYYPSSQLCSNCGYKWGRLNLSIRTIKCPDCLIEHDRDINAAKNMLTNYLKIV